MLERIDVVTLFPDWIDQLKTLGLTGRALAEGRVVLKCWNPRDFTSDPHRSVDDRPYGGGPGMVMRPEPMARAIEAAVADSALPARRLLMSPQGRRLDHDGVLDLAGSHRLILVCGRYEGVDQRLIDQLIDEEWSVGDYVLSGGEPAAGILIDALMRQLPGVLGHADSASQDSFAGGLLDCPHYTRPELWREQAVPATLLSGDHARIAHWRAAQAVHRTRRLRPDLLEQRPLQPDELAALDDFPDEYSQKDSQNSGETG